MAQASRTLLANSGPRSVCIQAPARVTLGVSERFSLAEQTEGSLYDPNEMMIIINLDHPVVSAALSGDGLESISFQRLSYEIAFSEYAIGLSNEMVSRDPDMPADDVLYEIRATLKRITRAAAPLYA